MDHLAFARWALNAEADAIRNVIAHLDGQFNQAVERLAEAGGAVIVSGMGKSGIIARKISATLASTGTPSHFLHPSEAMHGDMGKIGARDMLILLSYTGQTEEVLSLAALVKQDGVPVIAITSNPASHLAKIADLHLNIGDVTEACPHNLAPTASTTATLALGDALALAVSRRRNFSADDFKKRHPGGTLGRMMMPVVELLRFKAGQNLPLVNQERTVRQALEEAGRAPRRAGAILLVDEAGKLSGIFTDGDLRRLLLTEGSPALERPVGTVMTRNPRHLLDHSLVRDAVQLMREIRVDEIPIADEAGRPVGLLDVQDLIGLKVIES